MRHSRKFAVKEYRDSGHTLRETAEEFGVSVAFVWRAVKHFRVNRDLEKNGVAQKILDYLEQQPFSTARKLAGIFNVSPSMVYNLARKYRIKIKSFDRRRKAVSEYIKKHPGTTISGMCSYFNCARKTLLPVLEECGFRPRSRLSLVRAQRKLGLKEYLKTHPGARLSDAGKALGIPLSTTSRLAGELGIVVPKGRRRGESFPGRYGIKYSPAQKQEAADMFRSGATVKDVCKKFGMTKATATRIRSDAGVPGPRAVSNKFNTSVAEFEKVLKEHPYAGPKYLSDYYGVPRKDISMFAREHGIQLFPPMDRRSQFVALSHLPLAKIAEEMGISQYSALRYLSLLSDVLDKERIRELRKEAVVFLATTAPTLSAVSISTRTALSIPVVLEVAKKNGLAIPPPYDRKKKR